MLSHKRNKKRVKDKSSLTLFINILLIFLIFLDIILFTLCLFFPKVWFKLFHKDEYVDPQGLLRRTGAVWAAFTLFQFIAYRRWQKEPYWLAVVAGIRFTEIFSDWIYLYFAKNTTWLGRMGLLISPPANLLFGVFLLGSYRKIKGNSKEKIKIKSS